MLVSLVFSAVSIVSAVEKRSYEGTTLNLLFKEGYEIDVIKTYEVRQIIDQYIMQVAKQDKWLKENLPEIDWFLDAAPSEISEEHPIVNSLQEANIDVVGEKPIFSGIAGMCRHAPFKLRGAIPPQSYLVLVLLAQPIRPMSMLILITC